ncbi:MAG: glycosyltransferase [Acidimicrobiia bacterium]
MSAPASLQIQLVLYQTSPATARRTVDAVGAAVRHARAHTPLERAELVIGDCSPDPCLSSADVEEFRALPLSSELATTTSTHFGENLGSAGGSNRLAGGATADALLVLNPDTYPAPTMITELLQVLDDPTVAVAEGRQIPLEHPKAFDPVTGDASFASGCCSLVRRSVFEDVGGYDAVNFPMYCDDVDFSWRVRARSVRVVHVPTAVLFHDKRVGVLDGRPFTASSPLEIYWSFLARLLLAHKWARPDIVEETLVAAGASDDPDVKRAIDDYRARERAGTLPSEEPGAARVADFVSGGSFGPHRF